MTNITTGHESVNITRRQALTATPLAILANPGLVAASDPAVAAYRRCNDAETGVMNALAIAKEGPEVDAAREDWEHAEANLINVQATTFRGLRLKLSLAMHDGYFHRDLIRSAIDDLEAMMAAA